MSILDTLAAKLGGTSFARKSPWLIHYDAASCNGCDIEVLTSLTPLYDVERFGIVNTGNPRHADLFLVTGSVNEQCAPVIKQIYDQMVEPKVVIACGICACSGGVFRECYNTLGGIDQVIPVDVYAPGCAVRPEAIIDAVVRGLDILEQKRAALAQGLPVPVPAMPGDAEPVRVLHTPAVNGTLQQVGTAPSDPQPADASDASPTPEAPQTPAAPPVRPVAPAQHDPAVATTKEPLA
ncbi:MAG: NADH-quinone oxidoreductase subunit NuoB [Coriobacteriia bacterium]|nr:NADH-quinone oxidoreductase subunit NuoB [Coriobacteriia bacterium]MBS5478636.1 NADH-quinone oxidoreductase subunit NuoB [Coriobacteriia bacterium]